MCPVFQDFGPGLGAGIAAGAQNFVASRDRKRQGDLLEQQLVDAAYQRTRQRAVDAQGGMHILAPGELPPSAALFDLPSRGMSPAAMPAAAPPLASVSDVPADGGRGLPMDYGNALETSLTRAMAQGPAQQGAPSGPSNVASSRAGAGAANIPGHPANRAAAVSDPGGSFQAAMAPALAGMMPTTAAPSRGSRYEVGQGYYIDKQPQWDAADLARSQRQEDQFTPLLVNQMMAQGERNRKLQGYVAAGIPADRAQLYVDNPALAENDPKVGKPITPRSMEHVDLGNNVAVVDPVTGKTVRTMAKGPAPVSAEVQAIRDATLGNRKDAQSARNEARIVQQYTAATKKYSQTADAIQAINENREGALRGDPIAQQTLLQDFIKLNLPGQIVTAGELAHYAGLMGLGDKAGQIIQKLQQGSPLSQAQVKLILGHSDNLVKERRKGLKYIQDQYAERGSRQGVDPQSFVDWFGFLPGGEGAAAPPPGASSGNINLGGDTAGKTVMVNGKPFKVPE